MMITLCKIHYGNFRSAWSWDPGRRSRTLQFDNEVKFWRFPHLLDMIILASCFLAATAGCRLRLVGNNGRLNLPRFGCGDLIPNEGVWKRKMTVEAEIEMFLYETMRCFPQNNFKQTGNINLVLKYVAISTNMARIQLLSALDNIIYFHLHVGSDCGITCM